MEVRKRQGEKVRRGRGAEKEGRGGGGGEEERGGPTPVFPIFPHPQIPIFCMFNGDLWGKILKFGTKISYQYLCFKSLYCYC